MNGAERTEYEKEKKNTTKNRRATIPRVTGAVEYYNPGKAYAYI